MMASDAPTWFAGDLDDPWVAAIAEAVPGPVARWSCPGNLPDDLALPGGVEGPRTVIVHRTLLTPRDADCLTRLRAGRTRVPWVVLCVGPHVRHAELARWSGLVDAVVSEATARDTIARHVTVAAHPPRSGPRPSVSVVSANYELRATLAEACAAAGCAPGPARDWSEAASRGPALWDVPTLEPDWPHALKRRSLLGPVIALIGFADRAAVTIAREAGATACLELPCDLADLTYVLDRCCAAPRAQPAHELPPPPARRKMQSTTKTRRHEEEGERIRPTGQDPC